MDHHHYHHHDHDQYQHQMTIANNNPYDIMTPPPPPRTTTTMDSSRATTMVMDDEKKMMTTARPQEPRNCPRCNSSNTKFCYYNNYSLAQPRYLCKSCRRYWTEGGSLRNVPVGGGSRKNKNKLPLLLPNSSTSSTTSTKNLPDLNPPFVFTSSASSSNPIKTHENYNDLSLSFSSPTMQDKRAQGHYGHFTDQGQNGLFAAPMGMIQFRQENDHHDHSNKTDLGFSLDRNKEEIGNHDHFVVNGGKMMFPYGDHDDHERHDDGNKKRESGSSNELWSGIILGGDSGGPTW